MSRLNVHSVRLTDLHSSDTDVSDEKHCGAVNRLALNTVELLSDAASNPLFEQSLLVVSQSTNHNSQSDDHQMSPKAPPRASKTVKLRNHETDANCNERPLRSAPPINSSAIPSALTVVTAHDEEINVSDCEDIHEGEFICDNSDDEPIHSKLHPSVSAFEINVSKVVDANDASSLMVDADDNNKTTRRKKKSRSPSNSTPKKSSLFNLHVPRMRKHSNSGGKKQSADEDSLSTSSSLMNYSHHTTGLERLSHALNLGSNFLGSRRSSQQLEQNQRDSNSSDKSSRGDTAEENKTSQNIKTSRGPRKIFGRRKNKSKSKSTNDEDEKAVQNAEQQQHPVSGSPLTVSCSSSSIQEKLCQFQRKIEGLRHTSSLKKRSSKSPQISFSKDKNRISLSSSSKANDSIDDDVALTSRSVPRPRASLTPSSAASALSAEATKLDVSNADAASGELSDGSMWSFLCNHYRPISAAALSLGLLSSWLPQFLVGFCWGLFLAFLVALFLLRVFFTPGPISEDFERKRTSVTEFRQIEEDKLAADIQEELRRGFDDVIYKGWMNEWPSRTYNPFTYHVGGTRSVLVRLDRSVLRLSYPSCNIFRHAHWAEQGTKNDPILISQQMYDITGATVVLRPKKLARHRWWSRKYPICIIFRSGAQLSASKDINDSFSADLQQRRSSKPSAAIEEELAKEAFEDSTDDSGDESGSSFAEYEIADATADKQSVNLLTPRSSSKRRRKVLYLFARSGREKEHFFHRLRRAACHYEYRSSRGLLSADALFLGPQANSTDGLASAPVRSRSSSFSSRLISSTPKAEAAGSVRSNTLSTSILSSLSRNRSSTENKVTASEFLSSSSLRRSASETNVGPPFGASDPALESVDGKTGDDVSGTRRRGDDALSTEWILYAGLHQAFAKYFKDFLTADVNQDLLGGSAPVGSVLRCDLSSLNWKIGEFSPLSEASQANIAWANSLAGRIFWDFLRDAYWIGRVRERMQRKLATVRLPYFIDKLTLTKLDPGFSMPKIMGVSGPMVNEWGLWVFLNLEYSGGLCLELETKLNLMKLKVEARDLSLDSMAKSSRYSDSEIPESPESSADEEPTNSFLPLHAKKDKEDTGSPKQSTGKKILQMVDKVAQSKYFQEVTELKYVKKVLQDISDTPLVLIVQVKQLDGVMCINIPPAPTDRLWYGFQATPSLSLRAYPKVGDRSLNLKHITDWIESKLKSVFEKSLVIPNMDDLVIPVMSGAPLLKNFNV